MTEKRTDLEPPRLTREEIDERLAAIPQAKYAQLAQAKEAYRETRAAIHKWARKLTKTLTRYRDILDAEEPPK